jgi:hypothetical protein
MTPNQNPCEKEALLPALEAAGFDPSELKGPQGEVYVGVVLLDMEGDSTIFEAESPEINAYLEEAARSWRHPAFLHIAAIDSGEGCMVGLIGMDGETGEEFRSDAWKRVDSIEQALQAFQNYWAQRDSFIDIFVGRIGEEET